jgi:hypothetical protein
MTGSPSKRYLAFTICGAVEHRAERPTRLAMVIAA